MKSGLFFRFFAQTLKRIKRLGVLFVDTFGHNGGFETEEKLQNEMSKDSLSAIWEHYYKDTGEEEVRTETASALSKKRYRRVTKKDIIVRTLKHERPGGQAVSLHELSKMTGLKPHDLSGHLVHLINEGKIIRLGRGLFAIATQSKSGLSTKEELMSLVEGLEKQKQYKIEEKVIISDQDHSESKRMMLDFLNDALIMCPDVELLIKCKKNEKGKNAEVSIELKAH